jgi:hypothetical protein
MPAHLPIHTRASIHVHCNAYEYIRAAIAANYNSYIEAPITALHNNSFIFKPYYANKYTGLSDLI